jgi:thymidine phosphorylase
VWPKKQINNGKALEKLKEIIRLQGGEVRVLDTPDTILPKAKYSKNKSFKFGIYFIY